MPAGSGEQSLFKTDQESFWAGEFGREYMSRNEGKDFIAANRAFFSEVLRCRSGIASVLELGANIGLNLQAIKGLLPEAELAGVEINDEAARELDKIEGVEVFSTSILEFETERTWDLVFTKGVLIHIAPDALETVYRKLYECSARYICVAEYFNPVPVEVPYRGHRNRLFKRDFAGDLLDMFSDLALLDYGFTYSRDPNYRHDDLTWFLLEKSAGR